MLPFRAHRPAVLTRLFQKGYWVLLSICVFNIGIGFLLCLHIVWPTFGEGMYAYEGKESHSFTVPLYAPMESSSFHANLPMTLGSIHPTHFTVVPDDCLDTLRINGTLFPNLPENVCLDHRGATLDLSQYLHAGKNDLMFTVKDFGGYGSVSISPALSDPLILSLILGSALSFALCILFLMLFFTASKKTYILFFILLFGLVLRLMIAPSGGYEFDIGVNEGWAKSAAMLGMVQSYMEQVDGTMLPNYPPFSLMIFTIAGHIYQWMDPGFDRLSPLLRIVIKFPAILADILTALCLFAIVRRTRSERAGLLAALIYMLHPAVIYDSTVWGQTDSLYTLLIVATLWAAISKRWFFCGLFTVLAFFTKLQSIILLPTVFFFMLRGWKPSLRVAIGGCIGAIIILVPFAIAGNFSPIIDVYVHTVGFYHSLSFGGYNVWPILFVNAMGTTDSDLLFHVISYRLAGLLVFCLTTLLIVCLRGWQIAKPLHPSRVPELPLLVTALTAYSFFLFNTEMHERYLFPLMALSLPLIFVSRRGAVLYILGSLFFWLNLLGQLPLGPIDRALFQTFTNLSWFIGAMHFFIYIGMFLVILDASKPMMTWREKIMFKIDIAKNHWMNKKI